MTMMQMLLMATSSLTPLPDAYLDLNFASNSYRLADAASSFDAAFKGSSPKLTYGTTSNSTMVNSSGEIVWAPHNLLPYSEDFSNAAWTKTNISFTTQVQAPDGTTTAWEFSPPSLTDPGSSSLLVRTYDAVSSKAGDKLTWSVFVKPVVTKSLYVGNPDGADVETDVFIALNSDKSSGTSYWNTDTASWANVDADHEEFSNSVGNGWYHIGITYTVSADDTSNNHFVYMTNRPFNVAFDPYPSGSEMVHIWGAHVHRSDVGGMAPVPGAATGFETYVPTNGAAEYLPRVGHHVYNGSTWVNEGLLLESEARTNLLTYSADFSESAWSTTFSEFTMDAVGPDGASNSAGTLTDDISGGTGIAYTQVNVTVSTETTYTFSIFAKADQLSDIQIRCVNFTTPGTVGVYFDLSAGEVGNTTGSGATGEIEDFGSGWYRCSITFTTDVTDTSGIIRIHLANGESASISRDGTSSVLFYGAQLEVGSTPSSYIPTDGSTVTRDAQTLTVPSSELGWNSSGMSFAMEGRITASDDAGDIMMLAQWRETNLQRIDTTIRWNAAYQGNVQILAYNGSSPYSTAEGVGLHSVSDGVLSPYNIAWRHTSSTLQAASSGSAISNTGTPNNGVVDLSASDMTLGTDFMGTISHVRQWDEDIGETGIEEACS